MSDRFGSISITSDKQSPALKKTDPPLPRRPVRIKKKKAKPGKALFFSLVAFLLLVFYFLAGIYLAPGLLKKYLARYLHETAGLELTIESIQLNPLNFQLTLKEIQASLPKSPASAPLLQADSLFMDLDLTSLLRNGFVCDSLTMQGLQLNLIRFKDKSYNIPALFHFSTERNQGEIMDFAQLPFLFSLNNIDISDSRIHYDDRLTGKAHSVEQLHLAIPTFSNFSFQSTNYIQPHFSAIVNGSPVQLSGEAVQVSKGQGFLTRLSCSVQALDLVPYFSYLPSAFPLTLSKGHADTSLQIFFSPEKKHGSRLSIDIQMNASDIEMQSRNNGLTITTPALKLKGSLEPLAKRLLISTIVVREPQITGDKGQFAANMQELFSQPSPETSAPFHLAIDLALADQGRLILLGDKKTGAKDETWQSLELSIKNFKTAEWSGQKLAEPRGSFRFSGEQDKGKGSFSWQGTIAEFGKVHGKLLLNEFPATTLFDFLGPDPADKIEGSATFTGSLTLFPWQENSAEYILTNGTLQIDNLKLLQDKETWLEAESIHFSRLGRTEERFQLGDIFLKDATLSLDYKGDLPPLLKRFSMEDAPVQLSGIDFSGRLNIKAPKGSASALQLSDFHFQANSLDKPSSKDNFGLSANLLPDGLIKAKGSIAIAPFQVQANLAFSGIDSSLLSPFFSIQPLLQNSKATLHGKGWYRFPEPSFQGSLRLTETVLQHSKETPLLSWDLAELSKLDCRFSPFHLTAETLLLDGPQFQWLRKQNDTNPFQQVHRGLNAILQNKSSAEQEKLFPITLKEINFQNGAITYRDQRLSPPWSMMAEHIEGRLKNLNSAARGQLSSFEVTGTLSNSPFSLAGAVTLFPEEAAEGKAKLQLTDFPLATLHKQLASLPINPDPATLELHLTMTKEQSLFGSTAAMVVRDLVPTTAESDT
ncbi:MAG: DUF748 domain-containing protein, partial [Proteobacteria bacterium]|nr:DUF748 domain-containing protein [Pseudomonadota bacterium]